MAAALEHDARYSVALHHEDGLGLGRVGLRPIGSDGQVRWNGDRTRCVVMEGELYDTRALIEAIPGGAAGPSPTDHADLLLHLYEHSGVAGFARANGAFVAAIWDRPARQLLLVNDRLGLFPLYYARVAGSLLFASGVRALLAERDLDRTVDQVAISQFLIHDHLLDDRTLLEGVRLLPQASVLIFREGQLTIRPYWTLQYPALYDAPLSEEAYIEQLAHYLRQAVARQKPEGRPAAMLLSGGLDSRLTLGLLCGESDGLRTFTFGIPGCDDARVAAKVARELRTEHHFFELKPDWLGTLAGEAVRATDGMGNIVNLHAMATSEEQSRHAEIIYKGFLGDAMLGFAVKRQMWADYDDKTRHLVHRGVHRQNGVLNYEVDQKRLVFSDAFNARVGDAVEQAYYDGMDRSGSTQAANQRLYFDLTQRVPRMTLKGVEAARGRAIVRLPFADNDLLDFVLKVPPGFHFERYLQKAVLVKYFPRLAQIPMADSGRPLSSCALDVFVQAQQLASWHLNERGMGWLMPRRRRPYKDYNGWFRTILRPWVEETLLNPRTLDRGYFRPEFIRQLVAEHMAGTSHGVRIGALMTLELWHRQFID